MGRLRVRLRLRVWVMVMVRAMVRVRVGVRVRRDDDAERERLREHVEAIGAPDGDGRHLLPVGLDAACVGRERLRPA